MKSFTFEKSLVNEIVVRWVADHRDDTECRKVLTAHERAQRLGTKEAEAEYEMALRELWIVRPWEGAANLIRSQPPVMVPGGLIL